MSKRYLKGFQLKNVYLASYGYREKYNENNGYCFEFEKEIEPYVVNGYLKTDIKSLAEVAKILDNYSGDMLVVNDDETITFYDGDY